jgi:hypothetical protein
VLICIGLLLSETSFADATIYYVRKTGNDTNSGTSSGAAWLTITKAANTMLAGDTVYVGAGTYNEQLKSVRHATLGNPIRFYADTNGIYTGDVGVVGITKSGFAAVVIDHHYHEVVGYRIFNSSNGAKFTGGVGGLLQNCEIYGHANPGIIVSNGSTSATIRNCDCHDNNGFGMDVNSGPTFSVFDSTFHHNTSAGIQLGQTATLNFNFARCRIYSNSQEGVEVSQGTGTFKNCLIYDNGATGIRVSGTSTNKNFSIWNCTVVNNGTNGIWQSQGVLNITNSIIANNLGKGLQCDAGTMTHSYNLVFANNGGNYLYTGTGTGEVSSDPQFVNAGLKDFHLNASSPAINTGTNASGTVDDDLDSAARPIGAQWDMGCYECSTSGDTSQGVRIIKWVEIQ